MSRELTTGLRVEKCSCCVEIIWSIFEAFIKDFYLFVYALTICFYESCGHTPLLELHSCT